MEPALSSADLIQDLDRRVRHLIVNADLGAAYVAQQLWAIHHGVRLLRDHDTVIHSAA